VTWTKLDDGYWMHPAIIGIGNVGAGVFTRFLSYCGKYLTDGAVPSNVVMTILGPEGPEAAEEILDRMERMRLIDRFESGGVMIVNYLAYNRSRAQVEADREQRRENGLKGGRPRSSRS
jgi:hypothetical protein